jgi:hypothetical protein
MKSPRDQFLSCASLATDEHGQICGNDRFRLLQHTPHGSIFPDDLQFGFP